MSLKRLAFALIAIGALAVAVLPASASADEATPPADEIPLPENGDYLGSMTEDEADPGGYAQTMPGVQPATLKGFDPGNIINDKTMYRSGTMSAAQIQRFLNGKVAKCDPNYTCLKNFAMRTATKPANAYCSGAYRGAAKDTAAQIISKVSKACQVSERVLLVTLQKEQGLVTHTWPSDWRYDIAMGFGCPDGAACDSQYFGFQNQVYMAAKQLQRYTKDSYFSWYPVGKTSQVRWHPNAACGSGPVTIRNNATAALYYYTPYQPNRAALNAGYGTGDGCSAYGNRNFYNYFTDWFGSTQGGGGGGTANPRDSVAVHRFWSAKFDNAHFYTVNDAEANTLRRTDRNWTYEGRDFRAWPVSNGSCRAGTIAVHRFWSSKFASHFFTTNQAEMRDVRANDRNWAYEGIGFCAATSSQAGTVPVYRFWSEKFGKHFYTANATEAQNLRQRDPNWKAEGIALYAPKG